MAKQNKSHRFFATAATAALVASAIVPATASAATVKDFDQVPGYAKDAVQYLIDKGAVGGDQNGNFKPFSNLTRAQAAKIIAIELDLEATGTENFPDVQANHWFYNAVLATSPEIFGGDGNGNFNPNNNLTRQEAAKIIVAAFDLTGNADLSSYPDASKVPAWAKSSFEIAVSNGVINGKGSNLAPQDNITNAEFAAMIKRAVDAANVDPAVTKVTATSATQVEIQFNQAVDATSLFTNGKNGAFKASTVAISSLDSVPTGAITGTLSENGKTLTVTTENAVQKRYDVVVENVKTKDAKEVAKFEQIVTFAADTTAPTIVSTVKTSASTYKVTFSEPLSALGTVTYKLEDGTIALVSNDFTAGAKEVTFTLGAGIESGKVVTATIIGAKDEANNLLTPNPATVNFTKGEKDGVAPTVTSIAQTGAKTFSVKFSEQLISAPTVTIANNATVSVTKDETDATKYNVVVTNALDGLKDVQIGSVTDLSGEQAAATSKMVTFTKDTVAPKVVSSSVVVDADDQKEYLEVTFDKDVVLSSANVDATGSYVKDYVTTTVGAADITATAIDYKDASNKKVVRVELDAFLGGNDVEGAKYSLDLTFTGVASTSGVAFETSKASFTRGKDGVVANTTVLAAPTISQGTDNNKVNVTFTGAVDGASAINLANYNIDGVVIESATLLPLTDGEQVVVLNLKPGSSTFTGVRNITVQNVKALGSTKTMEAYATNSVSLNENVAPVVTSAKLLSTTQVELTFSESVKDSTGIDFEVLIGGVSQTVAETVDAGIGETASNKVTLTINAIDSEELAKGISLKALTTLDIVDAVGNKLSVSTNISVK